MRDRGMSDITATSSAPALRPSPALQAIDDEEHQERHDQHDDGDRGRVGVVVLLDSWITIRSGAISDTFGRLPAMKITEPYSPTARANASANPVSSAGTDCRQNNPRHCLPATGAETGSGLLDLGIEIDQYRLHGAHHERQSR